MANPVNRGRKEIRVAMVAAVPLSMRVFMRPHLEALASRYEVTAICSNASDLAQEIRDVCVAEVEIKRNVAPLADIVALIHLIQVFLRGKYHLVHSLTPKAGLLAMISAFVCRVPIRIHVFTGQVWATKRGLARVFLKSLDCLIVRLATHVLADSPSQRLFLISEGIGGAGKIDVLGDGSICGIDTERFRPDDTAYAEVRRELGIPATKKIILFLGRLNHDKGVLDLASAFGKLVNRVPDSVLVFVGPDECGMRRILEQSLSSCLASVRFVEMTSVPERYMAAADVFALPSYREGFGSVIIEAAACGVPAVASRIYGLTDAVAEGVSGVMHEPGSVNGILDSLENLLTDDALRHRLGVGARERALRLFQTDRIVMAQLDYYHKAIESVHERDKSSHSGWW